MLQNDSRSSKSDNFRIQNDVPELQNRPLNHLNTQKSTPKWNQNPNFIFYSEYIYPHTLYLTLSTVAISNSFKASIIFRHANITQTLHHILQTQHVPLDTLHFTLCTSHFLHVTQHDPAVCAKLLNKTSTTLLRLVVVAHWVQQVRVKSCVSNHKRCELTTLAGVVL